MSWPKEPQRHSMSSKGVKTTKDKGKNSVARPGIRKFRSPYKAQGVSGDTKDVAVLMASTMSIEEGTMPARMVLKHDKSNRNTPFITHLQIFPNYPESTEYHYAHGGYFTNVESAKKDYERRLDLYRVKDDPHFRRKE